MLAGEYARTTVRTQKTKGLPFGNPLLNLAEA